MTLSATYDPSLSRVQLVGTTFGATVTYAIVDRYDTATLTNPDTVRGGAHYEVTAGETLRLDDYEFTPGVLNTYRLRAFNASDVEVPSYSYTQTVTPDLDTIWLKSITRPFLNRPIVVTEFSEVALPGRGATFQVIGRRSEVAVTEVRGSRRYALQVMTSTLAEADDLELALSFGDVALIHVPDGCVVPRSMYAAIGDVSIGRAGGKHDTHARYFDLALTEVAAPAAELVGFTGTYGGLASAFATYADLAAALPTYLDVAQWVAAPSDEVVG